MQRAGLVVKSKQQRAQRVAVALLVKAKAGYHAVAVALVFDLEHHALVRLVHAARLLGHHPIQAGSLEARKPIARQRRVGRHRRQVQRWRAALQRAR